MAAKVDREIIKIFKYPLMGKIITLIGSEGKSKEEILKELEHVYTKEDLRKAESALNELIKRGIVTEERGILKVENEIIEEIVGIERKIDKLSKVFNTIFEDRMKYKPRITTYKGRESLIRHSTVYLLLVSGVENFNDMQYYFKDPKDPKINRADVLYRISEDLYRAGVVAEFQTVYDWKVIGRDITKRPWPRAKASKYIPIPPDIFIKFHESEAEIKPYLNELNYMSELYAQNYQNYGLTIDRGVIIFECQRDWEIYMTTYWLLSGRVKEVIRIKTRRGTWYKEHEIFRKSLINALKKGIEIKVIASITPDLKEEAEAFKALGGKVKHMEEGHLGIDRLIIIDDDLAVCSHRITKYDDPFGIYAGTIFINASEQINNLIKKFEYEFSI